MPVDRLPHKILEEIPEGRGPVGPPQAKLVKGTPEDVRGEVGAYNRHRPLK